MGVFPFLSPRIIEGSPVGVPHEGSVNFDSWILSLMTLPDPPRRSNEGFKIQNLTQNVTLHDSSMKMQHMTKQNLHLEVSSRTRIIIFFRGLFIRGFYPGTLKHAPKTGKGISRRKKRGMLRFEQRCSENLKRLNCGSSKKE